MKFTPAGGVIMLSVAYRSDNVIIAVEDSGPGIPADKLEFIFEPFRQADDTDTRAHGGAGLGLAISRQVLNLMGGDLYARNLPAGGAAFTMQIPLKVCDPPRLDETAPELGSDLGPNPSSAGSMSRSPTPSGDAPILLVEDDADMRSLVGVLIGAIGFDFDEACNGAEALEKLRSRRYGLVLMDIQMPVMDGMEAVRQVRADEKLKDSYVVALTARALTKEREAIDIAGFDGFLQKPIDVERLQQVVIDRLGAP